MSEDSDLRDEDKNSRYSDERWDFEHYIAIEREVSQYLKRHGWGPHELQARRIVDAVLRGFARPGALPQWATDKLDRLTRVLDTHDLDKDVVYLRAVTIIDKWAPRFQVAETDRERAHIANWAVGELGSDVDRDWWSTDTKALQTAIASLMVDYSPTKRKHKMTAPRLLAELNASVGAMGFRRTGDADEIKRNTKAIAEGAERQRARLE